MGQLSGRYWLTAHPQRQHHNTNLQKVALALVKFHSFIALLAAAVDCVCVEATHIFWN
jgi:hypothetical protein